MSGRRGLAVAGTHGKSSTTAMAAKVLVEAGCDPTVVFGATPLSATSGGRAGKGPLLLVEACEYRANFLHLRPRQAVILAVEPDHFDCYDRPEQLEAAFARFAANLPADGQLLVQYEAPRRVGRRPRRLRRGNLRRRGRGRLVGRRPAPPAGAVRFRGASPWPVLGLARARRSRPASSTQRPGGHRLDAVRPRA